MPRTSKYLSMNLIASVATIREGGKRNLNVADFKQALNVLRGMCRENPDYWYAIQHYLRYQKVNTLARAPRKATRGKR